MNKKLRTVFAADALNIIKNPFPILINSKPTEVDGYNINGHTYLKVADLKKANLEVLFTPFRIIRSVFFAYAWDKPYAPCQTI